MSNKSPGVLFIKEKTVPAGKSTKDLGIKLYY